MMRKKSNSSFIPKLVMGVASGLVILSTLLSACALNLPSPQDNISDAQSEESLATPSVDIQFIVTIPAPITEGQGIILQILDEVTGLPYNPQLYILSPLSETQYAVTLSFPVGSILKYRYVRIGSASEVSEATSLDGEVRYRLFHITAETSVVDSVQTWLDSPLATDTTTGRVNGRVVSNADDSPLPDILVSIGGYLTFTDANGYFSLDGISPGVQNIVFYAIDGAFAPFQQGAVVAAGQSTPINISLTARPAVSITFNVAPPNDARGVPIYMAGNIVQLGNTFTDLGGGMSIDPKRLPMLSEQDDGTYQVTLTLYAGMDLRYKFTLGDGYWNAERSSISGNWHLRQLIIPDKDVTIGLSIDSWRSAAAEPITFEIAIPPESNPGDETFVQFNNGLWTSPLPLWPLGNSNYLNILFSPLDQSTSLSYRFCRNSACDNAINADALNSIPSVQPSTSAQTVQVTLTDWAHWESFSEPTEVIAASVPVKSDSYLTQIELSPEMTPYWRTYAPIGISTLAKIGANSVQFTPQWRLTDDRRSIMPEIGTTPFTYEMQGLIASAKAFNLSVSLFPQLGPTEDLATYWAAEDHSAEWWQQWFTAYSTFVLNYANIATISGAQQLVLGGKAVLPAFSGGYFLDGTPTNAPATMDAQWVTLVNQIRSIYPGKLVWATNAQVSADPLPTFAQLFDAIYVTVDAPLSINDQNDADTIAATFSSVINEQVLSIHEQSNLPIILALGYPSTSDALEGCLLIDEVCSNDGLFTPAEVVQSNIDLDLQVRIYNTILPIAANLDWVSGISIRGYNAVVSLMDGSSSIAGKPARDVIWYWFTGFHTIE